MTVNDALKRSLVGRGQTVTDVSRKLGFGRPAVSNLLNGNTEVSIAMALRIEKVFAMSADDILHRQLSEQIEKARKDE